MISGVVFDLDNTLIDDKKGWDTSLRILCENIVKTYEWDITPKNIYDTYQSCSDYIWTNYNLLLKHLKSDKERRSFVWNETMKKLNVPFSGKNVNDVVDLFICLRKEHVYLHRDAKNILKNIQTNGVKVIICTDGESATQKEKINKVGLDIYISDIICGLDTGYRKPDERLFMMCVNCFQTPPDTIMYIGDDYNLDIVGAISVGMKTIWVDNLNPIIDKTTTLSNINKEFRKWFL